LDLDAHLSRIQAGDTDAFGHWVAGAEPSIRHAVRPFAARVDSEAVVQEALLRIWQIAPRFVADGKPNALLRFSLRVAKNVALGELRRARVTGVEATLLERLVDEASEANATPPPDPLLRRAVQDCREALPPKPALALSARLEASGTDSDEALAAKLGLRSNTFLQNFTRARKLLADCLQKKGIVIGDVT